ncbi:MAG: hypothetical protein QOI01_5442 [Mycobacterium sp.]|jgi:hypothetical protein|nr:hypothetical protein [Mycobacterium sp.]
MNPAQLTIKAPPAPDAMRLAACLTTTVKVKLPQQSNRA